MGGAEVQKALTLGRKRARVAEQLRQRRERQRALKNADAIDLAFQRLDRIFSNEAEVAASDSEPPERRSREEVPSDSK
jgi:hypothetical protein